MVLYYANYIFILKELMIPKKRDYTVGNLFQFSPYIIFLTVYSSLYFYTLHTNNLYHSSTFILTGLPVFAAFITTIYAFFTFKERLNFNKKIEIFLSGVAHSEAIHCYFIIIFTTIFNHMIAKTNGILTIITLGLLYIPTIWIMPSMFLLASLISIIIISLPVTIIICMPIAYGIAQSLQINPAFMAGTIIGGALYGNHISLYFNRIFFKHEIINNKNQKHSYPQKIWLIILAATGSIILLFQYQLQPMHPTVYHYLQSSILLENYITIIPYFFLLIASFLKMNLIANLVLSSIIALMIEIFFHKIMLLDAITTMLNGFYKDDIAVNILLLHLILAGLIKIIKYNGGFNYIIEKLKLKKNQNPSDLDSSIILIASITNTLIIIDSLTLSLITHPIERLTSRYNISKNNITSLLHITTTTIKTILPYSPTMFLAIHINHSSYIEIMNYMVYPALIIIFTILSTFISTSDEKDTINSQLHKISNKQS